jgi:hypothetical protein
MISRERKKIKNWWRVSDGCLTPIQTGRLIVGPNIALTSTWLELDFRTRHSITLQYLGLTDHATLNFVSNMPTATVFLDIEKAWFAIQLI